MCTYTKYAEHAEIDAKTQLCTFPIVVKVSHTFEQYLVTQFNVATFHYSSGMEFRSIDNTVDAAWSYGV